MKSLRVQVRGGVRNGAIWPRGASAVCVPLLMALVVMLWASPGWSFCGFYVSGASGTLSNTATQAVLLREGKRTVLSMQNNYQGPPKDFAMVVPVPVILQKENVKTLKPELFAKLDTLTSPRLVEYWEKDPCRELEDRGGGGVAFGGAGSGGFGRGAGMGGGGGGVSVKAQFEVGEYEIVILSAEDSGGLEAWLKAQKYNIPGGAAAVLAPYVSQGMYFFVARVNAKKVKFVRKKAELSPLRFHYDSDEFSLPVRLGMLNANGPQDLVVHILARGSRYRVKNRPNVAIPTNLVVSSKVKKDFGGFYAALFEQVQAQNPGAVVTEYAWSTAKCDPCPGPVLDPSDIYTFGVDTLAEVEYQTRTKIQASGKPKVMGALDREIIRRVQRHHHTVLRYCYEKELSARPSMTGEVSVKYVINAAGNVISVKVLGSTLGSKRVESCVARNIKRWRFPQPKGGGVVMVETGWRFGGAPGAPRLPASLAGNWSVTRLHTRYDAKGLSEDLVFEPAPSLAGGNGWPMGVKGDKGMLKTAEGGFASAFQARYIVLNPWKGKIACANPRRGAWGPPPESKVRNVRRGGVGLKAIKGLDGLVVGGDVKAPSLDAVAPQGDGQPFGGQPAPAPTNPKADEGLGDGVDGGEGAPSDDGGVSEAARAETPEPESPQGAQQGAGAGCVVPMGAAGDGWWILLLGVLGLGRRRSKDMA